MTRMLKGPTCKLRVHYKYSKYFPLIVSSTECMEPLLQVLNLFITFEDPRFLDNSKINPAVIFPILWLRKMDINYRVQ